MWIPVQFKGKKVWAQVGADGGLISKSGRTPVRYSDQPGAKVYNGGTARIEGIPGAKPVDLDAGAPAKKKPRQTKRGSGFGSAGKRSDAQTKAAREDLNQRMARIPEGTHLGFTDGACRGNPGPAGAGAVVKLADGTLLESSQSCGIATNNVGELTAINLALDLLDGADTPHDAPVVLFTDSSYVIGVLSKGWKAKANRVLILGLRKRLKEWTDLELAWVPGHAGVPENERADALASGACR